MQVDTVRPQQPRVRANGNGEVAIRIENLWKTYPGASQPAVRDVTLDVYDGEIVTLLGPSGCGKTTTLRLVAGLETPDHGDIYFGERAVCMTARRLFVPPNKRKVGMVFQSYAVWPHMTVEENVAFPLQANNVPRRDIKDRVHQALELVNMIGFENRPGPMLSGGQQQRVAIARALVMEPTVLLLDEPFSNLDAKLREQMRVEVKKLLQKQLKMTVLLVTHDQTEALSLSTRIAVMNFGMVQQQGTPQQLYEMPCNEFVRDFLGKTLIFKGRVQDSNPLGRVAVKLEGAGGCIVSGRNDEMTALNVEETVMIGVRPEDVQILPQQGQNVPTGMIAGKARAALFVGEGIEYQVEIDGQGSIMVYGERHVPIEEGSNIWLKIRPDGHTVWRANPMA